MKYFAFFLIVPLLFASCSKDDTDVLLDVDPERLALAEKVEFFKQEIGITIYYEPTNDPAQQSVEYLHGIQATDYISEEMELANLQTKMEEMMNLLRALPAPFLEKVDLHYLLLVSSPGLDFSGQAHLAIRSISLNKLSSIERSLHHELFHLFDPAPGLTEWGEVEQAFDQDWQALNAGAFDYGQACGFNNDPSTYEKGFITEYCKCSTIEERAVLFHLLLNQDEILLEKMTIDKVLQSKADRIIQLVNQYGFDL